MRVRSVLRAHRSLVIGAAAVAPLVACAVLALFRDSVANTNAALGLVLLIVAAAATGIRAAGIVAALSSAAWFDFFLTEPYNSFKITDRADFETAVLLVLVGVAVSEVALWGYRQQARVSQEQGYLAGARHRRDRRRRSDVDRLAHRSGVRADRRGAADRRLPF